MPKERGLYLNLPKLLTRQTMDLILLGYVLGYRHSSPLGVLQVRSAVEKFIEDFQLSEDEYSFDSAITRFYNLYYDLNEYIKHDDNRDKLRWKRMQEKMRRGETKAENKPDCK